MGSLEPDDGYFKDVTDGADEMMLLKARYFSAKRVHINGRR